MYPSGHIAVGYLTAATPALVRRRHLDPRNVLLPAVFGAITPDLIDKPLRALELTHYGRSFGHSIFFFIALVAVWKILQRRGTRYATAFRWWVVGIGSHFVADLLNDMVRGLEARGFFFTAWAAWPITDARSYSFLVEIGRHIRVHPDYTSLEITVFALTLAVVVARWFQVRRRPLEL